MTPSFAQTLPSAWRRAGSSAALLASLLFAFQPSLLLAQVQLNDPERPQPAVPPTPKFAQAPTPAPAPVPIQPPAAGVPSQPVVTSGAPGRPFAQSQIVPTEAPTLTLEVNKGTALKLPGPASTVFVA